MIQILPSILTANMLDLDQSIGILKQAGIKKLHLDVMDGVYVQALTFGEGLVKNIRERYPDIKLDVHLMLFDPLKKVEDFIGAGSDEITVHIETCSKRQIRKLSKRLRAEKIQIGVAINLETNVKKLVPILGEIDFVLVMSIKPGKGGQKFDESIYQKIELLNQYRKEKAKKLILMVEGGVCKDNISILMERRVDEVVVGNAIFKNSEIKKNLEELL